MPLDQRAALARGRHDFGVTATAEVAGERLSDL